MRQKIGELVRVYSSARLAKETPSRLAEIRDFKWNLVYVHFKDGEKEMEWVDCRLVKPESMNNDTFTA